MNDPEIKQHKKKSLPAGWWIVPGIVLGFLVWVSLFVLANYWLNLDAHN
jgi:hypothetical protein